MSNNSPMVSSIILRLGSETAPSLPASPHATFTAVERGVQWHSCIKVVRMELDHFLISWPRKRPGRNLKSTGRLSAAGSSSDSRRREKRKWEDVSSVCTLFFVSRHGGPLSRSKKKHLTTSGGRPARVPTYIPVAGESSQVPQQMGAFTRESVIKAVYLINVGYQLD